MALQDTTAADGSSLLPLTETLRKDASRRLDPERRVQLGQFLTPGSIAVFMDGMFDCRTPRVRILDPGAGTGALSAARNVSTNW